MADNFSTFKSKLQTLQTIANSYASTITLLVHQVQLLIMNMQMIQLAWQWIFRI